MENRSPLEFLRLQHKPKLPSFLKDLKKVSFIETEKSSCLPEIASIFPNFAHLPILQGKKSKKNTSKPDSPLRVGITFSGGPAAGGHNVLSGLFDALKNLHSESTLFGFLNGPGGILKKNHKKLSKEEVDNYRNLGGFDCLGTGRTKIETEEQMLIALEVCKELSLDGLVIVGGDDSHTNAAVLADFFAKHGSKTSIIGIPKTIDADLKSEHITIPFGFDTACRVYAELIGNICKDALSSRKYTHFIKIMGRSASHITLECALTTHPNYTFIGEEVEEKKKTLEQIVGELADLVMNRFANGKAYSVILIPEGLIQFIPEVSILVEELTRLLSEGEPSSPFGVIAALSEKSRKCFDNFPESIQKQLFLQRDPHGNVQLSLIETEKLLAELVKKELERRKFEGAFHPLTHFFGYEGRASFPSNFDTDYCYTLGHAAALLVKEKVSGYTAFVSNLKEKSKHWTLGALPITSLMQLEERKNKLKPVVKKTLISTKSRSFTYFNMKRNLWAEEDHYVSPGPMQFYSGSEIDPIPFSIAMDLT